MSFSVKVTSGTLTGEPYDRHRLNVKRLDDSFMPVRQCMNSDFKYRSSEGGEVDIVY